MAIFAMLLGTVFAKTDAGATTLASEQEDRGAGQLAERGICLPAGTLGESLKAGLSDGPPPALILESSPAWPGAPMPPNDAPGFPEALDENNPAFNLPTGAPVAAHTGTAPEPGEVNYRAKGPALQSADLHSWKSTEDTPPANPEDWLFRLQYTGASSEQASGPDPLFPIPEPTTGVLVLMGVTGAMVRRWRA